MSANFQSILNTRADAVEAPKYLPPGTYSAVVKNFESGLSTQKKTPYVEIKFQVDQIIEVAPELLEAATAALEAKGGAEMRTSFYLSDKSMYRLVDFLEKDLGLPRGQRTIGQLLSESIGRGCAIILDEAQTKDDRTFIEIKRTRSL